MIILKLTHIYIHCPSGKKNISKESIQDDVCEDHHASKEAVCLTCFQRLCFACAFISHGEHKITSMDKLEEELQETTEALQKEITSVNDALKIFRTHINTQQHALHESLDGELNTLIQSFHEQFQHLMHHLQAMRERNALSDKTEIERNQTILKDVEASVHFYSEAVITVLHESNVSHLQHLNELERQIDKDESRLDECKKHMLHSLLLNQCRPVSISARVGILSHGQILGAVKVTNSQMVMVRKYRNSKNYIHLACLSCEKPKVLFWEQTFVIAKNPPLSVMAKTLIVLPQSLLILVGYGRRILVITVHVDSKLNQAFFRSSKVLELNIPQTAHVTGISAILGEVSHEGIVTTDSESGMFHLFDQNFNLRETIKYKENCKDVTCKRDGEVYKIATNVNSDIVPLLRIHGSSKEVKCVGKIENNYLGKAMFIQSMIFDGSFLSILWVSKIENLEDGIQWRVVVYDDDDGDEYNVSAEGTCEPNVKPISISHIKNTMLLCFSNGSVKEFKTVNVDLPALPGAGGLVNALTQRPGDLMGELTRMLMEAIEFPQ
ncbi:hypothetical protein HOLleu_01150 [Holothuria leucospilota]|uniref:Uncharacterized protein n=1 Tax=Holothuria leucospilota TaxID=206669 RepID=A0A9Q1HK38_HOLLE|nr:hypothetical protein HOLleu_01150 [Holothuria leucospilota]